MPRLVALSPAEQRRAAQAAWRAEPSLTGAVLAARFGRKPRWGREQISTARHDDETARATKDAARHRASTHAGTAHQGDATVAAGMPLPAGGAALAGSSRDDPGTEAPAVGSHAGLSRDGQPAMPPTAIRAGTGRDDPGKGMPLVPGPAAPSRDGGGTPAPPGRASATRSREDTAGMPPTATPAGTGRDGPGNGMPLVPGPPAGREAGAGVGEAPRALVATTVVSVGVVTVVCAVVSYSHARHLAVLAGQGGLAPWLPFAVDGLVAAATSSLLVDRRRQERGHPLAWLGVALGLAGSFGANLAAVDPTLVDLRHVRWVLAGYVPAALAISGHLLLRMLEPAASSPTHHS